MGGGKQKRDDLDKMQSPVAAEIKHGFETEREDEDAVGLHSHDQIDDQTYIRDTLTLASSQMLWIADDIATKLTKLKDEISRKENSPWYTRLAEGILEQVIPLGLSSGAKALSTLVVESNYTAKTPAEKSKSDGVKELLKSVFKDAADVGVSQIKGALNGKGKSAHEAFIEGNIEAERHGLYNQHARFITKGAHAISTRAQAESLRRVLTYANITSVAEHQYNATRDGWLSYLAQSKFGATAAPDGKGTVTDMSGPEARLAVQDRWLTEPDFQTLKPPAPTAADSLLGHAPGVLEVVVDLPDLSSEGAAGRPSIVAAMLNGANDTIRSKYENVPLSESRIPRILVARVSGWMPDFTVNIDEAGRPSALSHDQATWLRARAVKGGMSPRSSEADQEREGLRLLLAELVPHEIVRQLTP